MVVVGQIMEDFIQIESNLHRKNEITSVFDDKLKNIASIIALFLQ